MISANTNIVPAGTSLLRAFRFEGLDVGRAATLPPAAGGASPTCEVLLALDLDGEVGGSLADRLDAARRRLGPGGVLLLALPNRFGLRFWSGCPEPASGRLFSTLAATAADSESSASADGTQRFVSRLELARALERAGLAVLEWFFAVPEAAGPGDSATLISERLAAAAPELAAGLAWARPSADRLRPRLDLFAEALVGRELAQAGLFAEFASHFLVAAAAREAVPAATVWPRLRPPAAEIGWHCAAGRRDGVTTIFELGPGGITVGKRRWAEATPGDPGASRDPTGPIDLDGFLWTAPPRTALAPGEPVRLQLQAHLAAGRSEAFLDDFAAFFAAVRERFQPLESAQDGELFGAALDALVTNATRDESGVFHLFDLEWQAPAGFAASWWVLRNVAACLGMRGRGWAQAASGAELYSRLCHRLGLTPRLEADLACEAGFQAAVRAASAGEDSALAAALRAPWPVAMAQGLDASGLGAALELASAHQELIASYRRLEQWTAEIQQRQSTTEAECRRLESWAVEVQQANVAVLADNRRLADRAAELETRLRQLDPGFLS